MATAAPVVAASPNPALLRKVSKVLDMRVETPELSQALEDLCDFYGSNTLESRRNLRSAIERRGVDVSQRLVHAFGEVVEQLDKVDADVAALDETCKVMREKIDDSQALTAKLVTATDFLAKKEQQAELQLQVATAFLERFHITEQETQIIRQHAVGPEFMQVLTRLERLQRECKTVLRVHHKPALLELVDEMASLQDAAYDRLYRWLMEEVRMLEAEVPTIPENVRNGVAALKVKSALFQMCLDEIGATRRQALLDRFVIALTQGGPNQIPRPIEMHAHEPLRYVGDMLGWLHQALATESELLAALLGRPGQHGATTGSDDDAHAGQSATRGAGGGGDDGRDEVSSPSSSRLDGLDAEAIEAVAVSREDIDGVLDAAFVGVCRPLQARVDQVLGSQVDAVVAFKLSSILQFYLQTMGTMLPPDATLTRTLNECSAAAVNAFRAFLAQNAEHLERYPLACSSDASVPPQALQSLEQLRQVLISFDSSLVPERMRNSAFRPVLESSVDPLLAACALASHALPADEAAVFLANVAIATVDVMQPFAFTKWRCDQLRENIATYTEGIIVEQVTSLLRRCSMEDKIRTLESVQAAGGRLADAAGMDALSVTLAFKQLNAAVMHGHALNMTIVDKIANPELKATCRRDVAQRVLQAYEALYDAVMDGPGSGYSEPMTIVQHDKEKMRVLLSNVT